VFPSTEHIAISIKEGLSQHLRLASSSKTMKPLRWIGLLCCSTALAVLAGCSGSNTGSNTTEEEGNRYGNYTLHGTYYDDTKPEKASSNAKTTLTQLEGKENVCLIGLWAYNPPAILSAVKQNNQQGKVHIIGFDEDPITLKGIHDGHIHATVVQKPYRFGYQAISKLYHILANPTAPLPSDIVDGYQWIDHEVITKENVDAFEDGLQEQKNAIKREDPGAKERFKIAFITNNDAEFWNVVESGAHAATVDINTKNPAKGVELMFRRPKSGTAQDQSLLISTLKTQGVQAIAISVNDAKNQASTIDAIAAEMPVICVDNDAPTSKRRFYIGTNNVKAGKAVGELVKKVMPNGTIAIFVGKSDAPNAIERRQGVLDELAGEANAKGK